MLDDRDEEIRVLEQEVQNEAKALEKHQDNLSRLAEESKSA